MNKKPKVFVGVSGGVDSSVSLALLKQQGYDVVGVFLKTWYPDFMPCDWREERRSAMRVCATLEVPFLTLDCEEEYKKEVVDYMIKEYSIGRVPNPDIFCNKYVKFGVFLKKARALGADFIATGHYAQIEPKNTPSGTNLKLFESVDKEKEQSYFLYTLGQFELSHTLFPIGGMHKSEVRKLAHEFGLPTAEKKDSQGLCFMGKIDMKEFLAHYIPKKDGDVLNIDGEKIGTHDGAMFFAIGQRHGFTITKKTPDDPRFFVTSKDVNKNTITVASKESELEEVYSTNKIILNEINFISGVEPALPFQTIVRIRYHQEPQSGVLEKDKDGYCFQFNKSQNGIAVGQSAVFYDSNLCIGGGIIEKAMR